MASGALGLTLTFMDKISPLESSIHIWIIIVGCFSLAITLFLNLLSHYISSSNNTKTVQDIDNQIPYEKLISNIEKGNRTVSVLNLICIVALGFGIVCILIFTSINAYNG